MGGEVLKVAENPLLKHTQPNDDKLAFDVGGEVGNNLFNIQHITECELWNKEQRVGKQLGNILLTINLSHSHSYSCLFVHFSFFSPPPRPLVLVLFHFLPSVLVE